MCCLLCHLCLWQRVCFFLCFKNLVTCICIHLRFSSPIKCQWEIQYCIQLDHFSKLDFQHQTQYLVSWKVAIFTSLANVIKDKLLRGRNGDWCEFPLLTKPWCIMWFCLQICHITEHLFFFYLLNPDHWCIETLILIKIVSWWKFALGTNYNWQTAKKWNTTTLHNSTIVKSSKTYVISIPLPSKKYIFTKKMCLS